MNIKKIISNILLLVFAVVSFNGQTPDDMTTTKRLADLCELWGNIKFFHPYLAYRHDIDWDDALIKTLPKVREAKTSADYEAALQSMLDVLGDPATKIVKTSAPTQQNSNENLKVEMIPTDNGNIILIKTGSYFTLLTPENRKKIADILPEVPKAKAIVFDLRLPFPAGSFGNNQLIEAFSGLERFISTKPLSSPSNRFRFHNGYKSQSGAGGSGGYMSGFYIEDGKTVRPISTAKDVPSVFLVNENSGYLVSTIGKQTNGNGLIVFEGDTATSSTLTTVTFPIMGGSSLMMRYAESVNADGSNGELQPDEIITKSSDGKDKALEKALELAKNFKPSTVIRKKLPANGASMRDLIYPDMKNPSLEYRLLALFRIWNVFNHFFPYKDLMDKEWKKVLPEFIPKFEQAKDSREYVLAVKEMLTYTSDGHVGAFGTLVDEVFGGSSIPVKIRMIEGLPTVFRYVNETVAKESGIEIGDVILKVDGEEAKKRLDWYAKYTTASNDSYRMSVATNSFFRGAENSTVTLTVQKSNGEEKEIKLVRKSIFNWDNTERTGEVYKLISPNIGYADLNRLTPQMLDEMFEKFKETKAIVFDMRGYPKGIFFSLAPRLTEKEKVLATFYEIPITTVGPGSSRSFYQTITTAAPNSNIYTGKTVMLIDERTVSQSEHTGLFLRAANGTKFIGSQTAGADGDQTAFYIPGNILITFTGASVKFPDGKQLQRIGLVPDIEVKPTIKGIREGKDEVLDRAVKYLETELKKDKSKIK